MKLSGILMIFPMLTMASQLPIWRWGEKIGDFVNNPLRQSRVPQFILDTRHPWILENKKKLERLPDAQSFLCSPPQELLLDPQQDNSKRVAAELEVPPDVFDYLEIGNSRYGTNHPSWSDVLERLQEMQGCPVALERVKTFKTNLYVGSGSESIDGDENTLELARPPDGLMALFADMLGNMTNLETLKWGVWPSHTQLFENHFIERGLVMPSVTRLEPDAMNHFLVRMCPNIIDLEPGGDSLSWWHYGTRNKQDHPAALLVRAGAYASSLETFSIDAGWKGWDMSLIQDILIAMPSLKSLGLRGRIGERYKWKGGIENGDGSSLKESLRALTGLKNMTHLELPSAYQLDVGWDGGPECGNAFDGPDGRQYHRQVVKDGAVAVDKVAAMILETLPQVESFHIGVSQANLTRYENGTVHVTFPWTGRMDEWAMEIVPERPDDFE